MCNYLAILLKADFNFKDKQMRLLDDSCFLVVFLRYLHFVYLNDALLKFMKVASSRNIKLIFEFYEKDDDQKPNGYIAF